MQGIADEAALDRVTQAFGSLSLYGSQRSAFCANDSTRTEDCIIGDVAIRFWFATEDLRQKISPAFQHLRTAEPGRPDLTVIVYDRASAATLPGLDRQEQRRMAWEQRSTTDGDYSEAGVSFIDAEHGLAYWYIPEAAAFPYFERAAPLRILLTYCLGARGRFLAHTAAVGNGREGVLIVGCGGAGKSTTSLSCLSSGLQFAGDDFCLLSAGAQPKVHSLYASAKLAPAGVSEFPSLLAAAEPGRPDDQKVVFLLHKLPQLKLSAGFPLKAILLPRIRHQRETRICPTTSARGYLALTPSGGYHLPSLRAQALKCFSALSRRLPVYELQLGSDWKSVPQVIGHFIDRPL